MVSASTVGRTELLAPAGDAESLRAAVANGADAVYFGLPDFNARRRAANFTLDELPETFAWLHRHNVRGYVTFNTLVFDDELDRAAECLAALARAGADAVIVQDVGLVRLVRRLAPSLPVHASTQMTMTDPAAIERVRELGVARVILARELSLDDIGRIARVGGVPLEVFVHGALCISYSGQCQASHVLMDRSANRGLCAQPCRLSYDVLADGRPLDGQPPYPLCPKDLAVYDRVRALVDAGVAALKIEGRLKDARYVAAAVRAYRAALDAALDGRAFTLDADLRAGIEQSFSRGFTHGFLDGPDHQDLVHGESPKSRGLRVGAVVGRTAAGLVVALDGPGGEGLKPGDGLVIDDGRPAEQGETGGRVAKVRPWTPRGPSPKRGRGAAPATAASVTTVEITFILDGIDPAAVSVGAVIWKNDDPQVEKRLRKTFSRVEPVRFTPLAVQVRGEPGGALSVRVTDGDGREAAAEWPGPLEAARKHPLTADLVAEQFSRLGGTPFELRTVELLGPDGPRGELPVMVPKSVLNDLRRQVIETLTADRDAAAAHAVADPEALSHLRAESDARRTAQPRTATLQPQLYALVRTEAQLAAAIDWNGAGGDARLAMVYADFRDEVDGRAAVIRCRDAGLPVALATRRIMRPGEQEAVRAIVDAGPDAVLVRNPGSLALCRTWAPHLTLVADASLNVANELAAGVLADWGAARFTPAAELGDDRLAALAGRVPPESIEAVVHRRAAMFHTEHCLFAARLSAGHNRRDCGRPCRNHTLALRGRDGAQLPVQADAACRNTIYAATVHSAANTVPRLRDAGVRHFRVELLDETAEQTATVLTGFARVLHH
ncbi:MAG: U32 family peptidase [Planctomycetes bacterium]|nr:U32 family peptidase [Planctomycetota bacterium]